MSPQHSLDYKIHAPSHELGTAFPHLRRPSSHPLEPSSPTRAYDIFTSSQTASYRPYPPQSSYIPPIDAFPLFEPFSEYPSSVTTMHSSAPQSPRRLDPVRGPPLPWRQQFSAPAEWLRVDDRPFDYGQGRGAAVEERSRSTSFSYSLPAQSHEVSHFAPACPTSS
jgi:hypothetical protein